MTRLAEAEAWVHRSKRLIHNQLLIQFFSTTAIIMPLPIATFIIWTAFGLASPMVIQSFVALWAVATIVYVAMTIYVRIQPKKL